MLAKMFDTYKARGATLMWGTKKMLIHCVGETMQVSINYVVARHVVERYAIFANRRTADVVVHVEFVQPMSEVLRMRATARAIREWQSDRAALVKRLREKRRG